MVGARLSGSGIVATTSNFPASKSPKERGGWLPHLAREASDSPETNLGRGLAFHIRDPVVDTPSITLLSVIIRANLLGGQVTVCHPLVTPL